MASTCDVNDFYAIKPLKFIYEAPQ